MAREDNPVSLVPVDLQTGGRRTNPTSISRPLSGFMVGRSANPAKGTAMKVAVLALVVVATKYAVNLVSMVTDKLNISSPKVKGILHAAIGVGVWIGGDVLARKPFAAKYGLPVQSGAAIIGGVIVADALDRLGFMGGPAPSAVSAVASTMPVAPTVAPTTGAYRHHSSMHGAMLTSPAMQAPTTAGYMGSHGSRPAFRGAIIRG
jgi:hypothetical protein